MKHAPPRQLWLLVPVLAVLAVAAGAVWWQTGKATWQPPAALRPELPNSATHTFSANALQTVGTQHAQERPLLWVTRRPLAQDATITPSETSDDLGNARLVGVFESGNHQRVALLLKPDGSKLTITSHSQPWRIEAFNGKLAVFISDNNQRLERPLEAGAAPPKPPPPEPPSRQRQRPQPQSQPPELRQTPVQPRT